MLWEEELPGSIAHTPFEIHRLKGRIPVQNGTVLLVQGVRNIYETTEDHSGQGNSEEAKLVLIGKGVDQSAFRKSLLATLGST
jgi:G3E family GTPase